MVCVRSLEELLSLRPSYFLNKLAQQSVILFAGAGFHSAGNINPIRTHDSNRRRYVFHLQAARQNNTAARRSAASNVPIGGAARTTILVGVRGVKQKGKSRSEEHTSELQSP